MIAKVDIEHIAWMLVHKGVDLALPPGCSCKTCSRLREFMEQIRSREAAAYKSKEQFNPKRTQATSEGAE